MTRKAPKLLNDLQQEPDQWAVSTSTLRHWLHLYADRLLRHPSPLTTIVKHSRQVWNHHLIHHPQQSTAMSLCRQPATV